MQQYAQAHSTLRRSSVVWSDALTDLTRPIHERLLSETLVMSPFLKKMSHELQAGFFGWIVNTVRTVDYVWPPAKTQWKDCMKCQVPDTHAHTIILYPWNEQVPAVVVYHVRFQLLMELRTVITPHTNSAYVTRPTLITDSSQGV